MKGDLLQVWIVFHPLETIGSVLTILGRDVARHARDAACLLLSTLKNNLDAIAFCFLCHCLLILVVQETFGLSTAKSCAYANLINEAKTCAGNLEGDPTILLGDEELLLSDVREEPTLDPPLRMGNVVSILIGDASYLTKLRHCSISSLDTFSKHAAK